MAQNEIAGQTKRACHQVGDITPYKPTLPYLQEQGISFARNSEHLCQQGGMEWDVNAGDQHKRLLAARFCARREESFSTLSVRQ